MTWVEPIVLRVTFKHSLVLLLKKRLKRSASGGPEPPPREEPILEPICGFVHPPVVPCLTRPGRRTNQLQFIEQDVMERVWRHQDAAPFHNPVDTVALGIPNYHDIIKHPMDLNTIRRRLENAYYWNAQECIDDFHRLFQNCYLYNGPRHRVVVMARNLVALFQARLESMPEEEVEIAIVRVIRALGAVDNKKGTDKEGGAPAGVPSTDLLFPSSFDVEELVGAASVLIVLPS